MFHYPFTSRSCAVCGNNQMNRSLTAREMMYGTGESFIYLYCASCGVLHLMDIPDDMGRFYPGKSYYSVHSASNSPRQVLKTWRDRIQESGTPLGDWVLRHLPNVALAAMTSAAPDRRTHVLDVGCGDGSLLRSMARLGYRHLTGVDPLLDEASATAGMQLIRGGINTVEGRFDLISFHHSLEHIPDQVGVLRLAAERLTAGGKIVVRIPTSQSLAFAAYGPRWVQLDAPRHLFLHSHRSIALVAQQAGLSVVDLRCDSQPMQFWASDMYCSDVPLVSPVARVFKRRHRRTYKALARWANEHRCGDQIIVTLSPI